MRIYQGGGATMTGEGCIGRRPSTNDEISYHRARRLGAQEGDKVTGSFDGLPPTKKKKRREILTCDVCI